MKKPILSALFGLALSAALSGAAQAQSWSDFASAFPAFPCHDGWMGCLVGGARIEPELQSSPADLRVSWFELTPTTAFSPFVGLSQYTGAGQVGGAGEGNDAVAVVDPVELEPDPKEIQARADAEAARQAEADAQRRARQAQAERERAQAARRAADEEQARREREAAAARAEADRLARQQQAARDRAEQERIARQAAEAQRKAEAAAREREAAAARAREQQEAEERARQAQIEEERRRAAAEAQRIAAEQRRMEAEKLRLAEEERLAAERARAREAARLAEEKARADAAAVAAAEESAAQRAAQGSDDSCDELPRMEPSAMLGRLTPGQIACLEGRVASDPKMTDKEKASLVLLANAWASNDRKTWESLVKRHLDEIDQSDPDLCYKYALYLSNAGGSRASGVIRWVEVALDNRTVWTGDTYTSRVNSLYRLRAKASQDLWKRAEQDHAGAPSDDTRAKVEKYRNMTKVNAREWYEYARSAGKDQTVALQLCMSAAGTKDYCEAS